MFDQDLGEGFVSNPDYRLKLYSRPHCSANANNPDRQHRDFPSSTVDSVINGIPTREDESPYKADRSTGFPAPDASLILVESSWLYFYMQ